MYVYMYYEERLTSSCCANTTIICTDPREDSDAGSKVHEQKQHNLDSDWIWSAKDDVFAENRTEIANRLGDALLSNELSVLRYVQKVFV